MKKRSGSVTLGPKPKAALPLCYGKVFKTASLHPLNRRERPAWETIRAAPEKAATDDFQPIFNSYLYTFSSVRTGNGDRR